MRTHKNRNPEFEGKLGWVIPALSTNNDNCKGCVFSNRADCGCPCVSVGYQVNTERVYFKKIKEGRVYTDTDGVKVIALEDPKDKCLKLFPINK